MDLEVSYTLTSAIQPGLGDRICLYELPHLQPHEHVAFVWAADSKEKTLKANFSVSALPKEVAFYQLQYLKGDNYLAGSSIPFKLKEVFKKKKKNVTIAHLPLTTPPRYDKKKNTPKDTLSRIHF